MITELLCNQLWSSHQNDLQTNGLVEHSDKACFEDFKHILDVSHTFVDISQICIPNFKGNAPHIKIWSKIYSNIQSLFTVDKPKSIVISISGGVDSMLLSLIMSQYCQQMEISLSMLHINYNNRDCCDKEVKFLVWWSNIINCKLYVKSFDIVRSRNSKERALYENITRRIRYSIYKYLNSPILLGHNIDDCYENMFSNLSKRIHFDNLFGMSKYTIESDIPIVRPMLDITKEQILTLAHTIGIPYLEDSTPAWSNRGKMRDILIPQISQFNPQILTGLADFATYTSKLEKQWNYLFHSWKDKNIKNEISDDKQTVTISKSDEFYGMNYDNLNFWIKIWFEYKLQTRPSNKSFDSMIKFLEMKRYTVRFELNNASKVYNNSENVMTIIVYSNSS